MPSVAIRHVEPYSDEWLQQPISYVQRVIDVLGSEVAGWWEGPCDPRDATLKLADGSALVWDEESGWRLGTLVSGGPGLRSELAGVRYLGHGLLPRPERVPSALGDARAGVGASSAWRPCYRSHRNCRDGFDVALDFYCRLVDA
ncbi:hypothetical protein FE391_02160 [Nonomuraea sp. KC401]|uniref:DUF6292 domain-containing protein n=1 Tax=Nonomuraea longispora TaxID=1848320 RepID=A0A4R4NPC2_9ACTN|nr:hypothetical protein [Nonomuraea sp. K271]TDC11135.1 hypothetical protein E1267_01515 [Nonomuraea longispora]TLF85243.1 hypothetical protein FE391_02160 [Nonomuraea sp. KC401]